MQKIKSVLIAIGLFIAGFCLGAVAIFFKRGIGSNTQGTGRDQQSASRIAEEARADNNRIADLERRETEALESARNDNLNAQDLNGRARELIEKAKNLLDTL